MKLVSVCLSAVSNDLGWNQNQSSDVTECTETIYLLFLPLYAPYWLR